MIKIATVFSGIGAPEQALKKLVVNSQIVFACDTGEIEIKDSLDELKEKTAGMTPQEVNACIKEVYKKTGKPNYVKQSYMANYNLSEDNWYDDIRFLDGKQYKGNVDIFVGGSPCQSFSVIGKRAGLEDTRGTLFYEFARLVKETEPKVFIYENVPGMLVHDKGNTWKVISSVFDSLGYKIYKTILNAKDFGIPQDRKRLFVVGFKNHAADFKFPEPVRLETTTFDYLEPAIDAKYYLGKKGFEFVTNPKYKNRARVNKNIIQTEKANQQFNWNGDFIFEELDPQKHTAEILNRAYVGEYEGKAGVIRQLTHRECLRLMGFPDTFHIVVPNVWAYRQAGNSIVVNVLAAVLREVMICESFK